MSDLVIESALERLDRNDETAARDRERYEAIYQPLEDQAALDAQDYASPWKREEQAGMAMADVSQQFDMARNAATERLESFGIDPSQTRAGALDVSTRTQEAAARASAGNQSRQQTDMIGRALRDNAINTGKGYPGSIAQQYGTALNSGNQAVNSGIATTGTGAQTMGTGAQWQGLSNNAINGWWSGTNQMYGNQIEAYKAENAANAQAMQLPGMILGGAMRLATGGIFGNTGGAVPEPDALPGPQYQPPGRIEPGNIDLKNRPSVKNPDGSISTIRSMSIGTERGEVLIPTVSEDGRVVSDDEAIEMFRRTGRHLGIFTNPDAATAYGKSLSNEQSQQYRLTPQFSNGGMAIPEEASPSRGAVTDDVPARLQAGEFIMPEATVRWHGEKAMHAMIEKAQRESQEIPQRTGAIPEVAMMPQERPAVSTAIPMG